GMFAVWGANHNFFNTEWQVSDSSGCTGAGNVALFDAAGAIGSPKQRETSLHGGMSFFRTPLGAFPDPRFGETPAPSFETPTALQAITRVERAFADAATQPYALTVEDFSKPTGTGKSGLPTVSKNVTSEHTSVEEHDPVLRAAALAWASAGADTMFQ